MANHFRQAGREKKVGTDSGLFSILLVEDNPADVRLVRQAINEISFPCSLAVAGDEEEAMSCLPNGDSDDESERPHIILLDLNLRKKGNLGILKKIKEDPDLRRIPVIVLASSNDEQDIESAYAVHANCYITKPADSGKLLSVIKSTVNYWTTVVKV